MGDVTRLISCLDNVIAIVGGTVADRQRPTAASKKLANQQRAGASGCNGPSKIRAAALGRRCRARGRRRRRVESGAE
jgi:hypothetical protein